MLNIAICEDEERYADDLKWCLEVWAANSGINIKIKKFNNGIPLLEHIQSKGKFNLIFMDIEMEKMNGLETAVKIRETDYITAIVFVSQYEDYYKAAYDVHPFHFLCKPISPKKLESIMDAYMKMKKQDVETYTFSIGKAQYSLRLDEIVYFRSEHRHVNIIGRDCKYRFYGTLGAVQKELEQRTRRFIRIHQSYLVNTKYIREYHFKELVLYNGETLGISRDNRMKMRELHMLLLEQ
ncbi:MAG: LytTR family DNA-binding domain-containing protein [Firmicutes bacterium]|nr:LytTR family DNA-binding domain-containing protein [Bacillota bacterium]